MANPIRLRGAVLLHRTVRKPTYLDHANYGVHKFRHHRPQHRTQSQTQQSGSSSSRKNDNDNDNDIYVTSPISCLTSALSSWVFRRCTLRSFSIRTSRLRSFSASLSRLFPDTCVVGHRYRGSCLASSASLAPQRSHLCALVYYRHQPVAIVPRGEQRVPYEYHERRKRNKPSAHTTQRG